MATTYDKASLVMIPSGYKDDKLYAVKPTDGSGDFTFSRDGAGASPATRVNASGLIEKGRTNEILQSNQFDTTWGLISTSITSGQSGYDGTNDAWLLSKSAADGSIFQTITNGSSVYTSSFYAKKGSSNWAYTFVWDGGTAHYAYFDLLNGSIGSTGALIDSSIESVGNGYYRCSITFNSATSILYIYPADGNGDTSGTSGDIYIQDAQLEQGLIATSVIETTTAPVSAGLLGDMPRLDYSGGATCPSLLLEPSRVNFIPHSEYFSDWALDGDGAGQSVTANYSISPEGVQNAYRLQLNTTGGSYSRIRKSVTASYSGAGIFSVYLKTNDASTKTIRMRWSGSGDIQKTITGDWQRFDVQGTATNGLASDCEIFLDFADNDVVDLSVYGAMQEAGSYPTSYIPTYGTAAPRGGDICLDTTATDLIGQTEGTLFFECTNKALLVNARYFSLSNGGPNDRIDIYHHASDKIGIYVAAAGAAQLNVTNVDLPASGSFKFALAYANNDYVWYVNGSQIGTDTSASVPSLTHTLLGTSSTGGANGGNNPFKQALLFKTRLTNAELAALTTL